jgi:hypothetical protein
MGRRALIPAAALTIALLIPAATAIGDADPPSDLLLVADAYYPYTPAVPKALQAKLGSVLRAARKRRHVYKIALIGERGDLGAVPVLFGKTQRYATFLFNEIKTYLAPQKPTLIVVTKQGLALRGRDATSAGTAALAKVTPPSAMTPAQLVATAIAAVKRVAAANGHPINSKVAAAATVSTGHKASRLWLIVAAGLALVGALGAFSYARRQ